MTPKSKEIAQWANPMTSNHKRDEFTTKKKDGKPKRFGTQNPRKEKLSLPRLGDQGESNRKSWARIPRGCQRLEIHGTQSTAEVRLRQLKGSTKKAQGTKDRYVFLKHPVMQQGIRRHEVIIREQRGWYFREPRMKNYKGKGLENLQHSKKGF